ncbi:MAG: glycosyltransferase family 4 protein [Candidatus Auribacterota bacterium]|nr:glycosyltransferase family 4 protein [Candidatus Auribacterota bacterium]
MKNSNLYYIASARLPTEKANGHQIVKMCNAFSKVFDRVELIIPFRLKHGPTKEIKDIYSFYGIEKNFGIKIMNSPDFLPLFREVKFSSAESLFFILQERIFAKKAVSHVKEKESGIVFTRSRRVLRKLVTEEAHLKHKIIYECHRLTKREAVVLSEISSKINLIVALTEALKEDLLEAGIAGGKILVCPDGVDLKQFEKASKDDIDLGFEKATAGKFIAGYAGSFYNWKGITTFIQAVKYLKNNICVVLAGSSQKEFREIKKIAGVADNVNLKYIGYLPPKNIPCFIKKCNVMVVPNTATDKIFSRHSSPLKLFESMACGVLVIGSNLPCVSEIIRDKENGLLFEPDNPHALAEKIEYAEKHPEMVEKISLNAKKTILNYTWEKRVEKIITRLN